MTAIAYLMAVAAIIALGLMTGALVAEGAILVPFWRGLEPEAFLTWYKQHAKLLQKFFGPLEIVATLLTIAASALLWVGRHSGWPMFAASGFLGVAVLGVFPIYFQSANTSFAKGTIHLDRVNQELRRWSRWHWFRTIMAGAGFVLSVIGFGE